MKLRHARKRRSPASLRKMRVKVALMRVSRAIPFAAYLPPMIAGNGWRMPYAPDMPATERNPDQWIDSPREWRRNGMETR